jgi:hypothetical protein
MEAFTFEETPGRLRITLHGGFDEPQAIELERAIKARFSEPVLQDIAVIHDFTQLDGCTILARSVLVRIQELLATRVRRSVFLCDKSLFRGLALWITHISGDDNAKAVTTVEQLEEWLQGRAARVPDLQARMGKSVKSAVTFWKRDRS